MSVKIAPIVELAAPENASDHMFDRGSNQVADEPLHDHRTSTTIISMDTLGIAASTLCLIHCLAMPFVITLIPVFGWQFLEGRKAHYFLAALVVTFAVSAIVPGYLKHRHKLILAGMVMGLSCVLFATFSPESILSEKMELPLITFGNIVLVLTHLRNRKLSGCTLHCH